MKESKQIEALVRLIEDPDEEIFEQVRNELIHQGPRVIPFLESSWEQEDYGLLFQSRVETLIQDIQFSSVKDDLTRWIADEKKNLLQGAIIVARYQYPNMHEEQIHATIQQIRKDIWLELNDNQTAYEKVRLFNKIFYGKYGFAGNTKNYHSPLNSYINTILETKKGNPLGLCLIYAIVAQSLDLPIYGVNLPNHFVLAYMDEYHSPIANKYGVLFYINAFSKGGLFDESEIQAFLNGHHIESSITYYTPCTTETIIKRMITNLIASYQQSGDERKVKELSDLRNLFDFEA